jgi:hypothetical protein
MATRLVVWENSFQSYADAMELALDRVDLGGLTLTSANPYRVESALIQSYHEIVKFSFVDPAFTSRSDAFSVIDLSADEKANLTSGFLYAIKMAQICEADSLLGGDPTSISARLEEKRRAGIREEIVGESAIKFGLTDSARYPVYDRTRQVLSQYLYRGIKIGRA